MIIDQDFFFFEKQTDFMFIKSKFWKHWKCKATRTAKIELEITAYRIRRKYTCSKVSKQTLIGNCSIL